MYTGSSSCIQIQVHVHRVKFMYTKKDLPLESVHHLDTDPRSFSAVG